MSVERRCDVAIVGAGPVGAGLAAALADGPLRVAIMDPGDFDPAWPVASDGDVDGYDGRVSAINERTRRFLSSLGVWEALAEQRCCALSRVAVWDGQGAGALSFSADELGAESLGYIVENRLLGAALLGRIARADNIETLAGVTAKGLTQLSGQGDCGVLTDSGDTVLAALVVIADGASSPLREMAGFKVWSRDYHQRAIVATVRTEREHERCAAQRFLDTGPLAFLPLGGEDPHMSSVVWTLDEARAESVAALDAEAFRVALADAFERRLGEVLACGERRGFPLRHLQAMRYAKGNLVLVGDAAHSVHPLAGQGINFGLHDVALLADELTCSGIGPVALQRYERQRRAHNMLAGAALDGIRLAFSPPQLAASWLRDAGMHGIDRLPALKRLLARQAMGL